MGLVIVWLVITAIVAIVAFEDWWTSVKCCFIMAATALAYFLGHIWILGVAALILIFIDLFITIEVDPFDIAIDEGVEIFDGKAKLIEGHHKFDENAPSAYCIVFPDLDEKIGARAQEYGEGIFGKGNPGNIVYNADGPEKGLYIVSFDKDSVYAIAYRVLKEMESEKDS